MSNLTTVTLTPESSFVATTVPFPRLLWYTRAPTTICRDMAEISPRSGRDMVEISTAHLMVHPRADDHLPRYGRDMAEIWPRYGRDMAEDGQLELQVGSEDFHLVTW